MKQMACFFWSLLFKSIYTFHPALCHLLILFYPDQFVLVFFNSVQSIKRHCHRNRRHHQPHCRWGIAIALSSCNEIAVFVCVIRACCCGRSRRHLHAIRIIRASIVLRTNFVFFQHTVC